MDEKTKKILQYIALGVGVVGVLVALFGLIMSLVR